MISLIIVGIIAYFIMPFILTLVSLPGRFIAFPGDMPGMPSRQRLLLGITICISAQSYLYFAYTAFIVNWTMLAIQKQGASFIILSIAFLSTVLPLLRALNFARITVKETKHFTLDEKNAGEFVRKISNSNSAMFNMLFRALLITLILTLPGLVIFTFYPRIMEILYNWVPYIGS